MFSPLFFFFFFFKSLKRVDINSLYAELPRWCLGKESTCQCLYMFGKVHLWSHLVLSFTLLGGFWLLIQSPYLLLVHSVCILLDFNSVSTPHWYHIKLNSLFLHFQVPLPEPFAPNHIFPPALLRYNWHVASCKLKMYNMMICETHKNMFTIIRLYISRNLSISSRLSSLLAYNYSQY